MKFAKYLQDEVVPEWRKAYINYKQGKKLLKAIEHALDQLEAEAFIQAENSKLPAYLLDAADLGGRVMSSSDHSPTIQYNPQLSSFSSPSGTTPQTINSSENSPNATTTTSAATPILSRNRGHARNYSTIQISPPPPPASAPVDNDRSGHGGSTLCEHSETTSSSGTTPGHPLKTSKTDSNVSQFSQAARSQGAHLLKHISRRFTIIAPVEAPVRTRTIQVDENDFDSVLEQLLPEEKIFFQFLDSQLEMVNKFYREKELEAVTKLRVVKQQLYVANEWKRRYDEKMARAEAEQGWYVAEWSRVRNGFDNLMRVDTTVTEDVTITPSGRSFQQPPGTGYATSSTGHLMLDPEQGIRYREHLRANPKLSPIALAQQEEMTLQEEEHRRQRLNHKVARTRIKAALYEFYRSLEMIKNYKVLNHTGFAKILKKFDKTAGWKASKSYLNSKIKPATFMTSGIIEDLIKETEDVFIDTFEKGHRRRGMAKLRIPDFKSRTHHLTATRIGLYLGLAAPLMVQALQAAFSNEMPTEIPYWDSLLLVYGGLFLTIMFACLFGINMYVWAKSRINYKFIFEFDPRDNLDFHEYFELPIFFLLLLTLAVYFDFGSKLTAHVTTAYWPLILMSIIAAVLFCPLPIAHFTSRRWFISSIGRIIASGYYRVEFRDFFLADEMNSLSYSMEQFEFAMCAYSQQWTNLGSTCSTSQMWITPFVTALPAWFRFLQCLRRYRDTLEWFPHLLNAGKYTASLVNLFIYFSYRHYGGTRLKVAWIIFSFFASVYTFAWDVYMDWGLFRFGKHGGGAYGHPFLRQELVYSRTWVYYMAIVLDFFGRFSWVVRLIPMNINVVILSFSLAFLEVLRRWQWNFFRLENEHLNNCGQFRAIKDIPLPFHIRVEGETDDEEEEEEEDQGIERHDCEPHPVVDLPESVHDDDGDSYIQQQHYGSPSRSGIMRSSSSHGSFARYSNGSHAHGLSNLAEGGGSGGEIESHRPGSTRNSIYSSSSRGSKAPRMGMPRKSQSQNHVYGAGDRSSLGSISRRKFHNSQPLVHPFAVSRSNSFVENAVAEAGFKDTQLEALGSETNANNRFYDRRDFDSKIIDADSGLWGSRSRSMTGGSSSLHGLQTLSLGGGGGGTGLEERVPKDDRRVKSQVVSRRKMSLGTRMKSAIFGRVGSSESDEDDEDEHER